MAKGRIAWLKRHCADLRRTIDAITRNPAQSASISSGGGSKSYSNMNLTALSDELRKCEAELSALLSAQSMPDGFGVNYARWC